MNENRCQPTPAPVLVTTHITCTPDTTNATATPTAKRCDGWYDIVYIIIIIIRHN
jgi:hypothetical protein